jgi:hypothetical protein
MDCRYGEPPVIFSLYDLPLFHLTAAERRRIVRNLRPARTRYFSSPKRPPPQGKGCELCGLPAEPLMKDHDHKTGQFRGWLCRKCNAALGVFGDDIAGLTRAIAYLSKAGLTNG